MITTKQIEKTKDKLLYQLENAKGIKVTPWDIDFLPMLRGDKEYREQQK